MKTFNKNVDVQKTVAFISSLHNFDNFAIRTFPGKKMNSGAQCNSFY